MDKETALVLLRSEQMTVRRYLELAEENGWNAAVYPSEEVDTLTKLLSNVETAARKFVREGVRLTPDGLIVHETADKSDPYCKLCDALDAIDPLNPDA